MLFQELRNYWSRKTGMSAEAKRATLNSFCCQEIDVEELAALHPECGCEGAQTVEGSPGPVTNDEVLRLFLTSPSDIRGERKAQREKRPFGQRSLQKAYTKGLSVVRICHASQEEIEYTASLLHAYQSKRDPKNGGLLCVVDFPVSAVREGPDPDAVLCALETPLDWQSEGYFLRPSHGDVVNSKSGLLEEIKKAKREVAYNRIVELGEQRRVEDVTDSNLSQFLPQIVVDEGRE
jgi:hypothetical protein